METEPKPVENRVQKITTRLNEIESEQSELFSLQDEGITQFLKEGWGMVEIESEMRRLSDEKWQLEDELKKSTLG